MKGWTPGEEVTDDDVKQWAEWELVFFDVEKALDYRQKVKEAAEVKPKPKAKPKRNLKCPATVTVVRASAFQHIKVLDNILTTTTGKSLK